MVSQSETSLAHDGDIILACVSLSVLMFIRMTWALMYRRSHCGVGNRRMIAVACSLLLFGTMVRRDLRTLSGTNTWMAYNH